MGGGTSCAQRTLRTSSKKNWAFFKIPPPAVRHHRLPPTEDHLLASDSPVHSVNTGPPQMSPGSPGPWRVYIVENWPSGVAGGRAVPPDVPEELLHCKA